MNRFTAALRTDVITQVRNRLYIIGPVASILFAIFAGLVSNPSNYFRAIPVFLLLVVGGTTLMYVAAMILFEKDEGTLSAVTVSPLRTWEYLLSKVVSLSLLALLESLILIGLVTRFQGSNLLLLVFGNLVIGIIYTLIGIVMIVRYRSITDFLVPLLVVALVLQLPVLYFLGLIESPLLLIIPSSAPTMLIQSAWVPLTTGQWVYALVYSLALVVGLSIWAYRAFYRHIIMKVG